MPRLLIIASLLTILLGYMMWGIVTYFVHTYKVHTLCHTPYVGSFNRDLKLIKKYIKIQPHASMCDLGCGDGKALRFFAKWTKSQHLTGYDLHTYAIKRGKQKNKILGYPYIKLHQGDFFHQDIKNFDIIYCYLFPSMMEKLMPRLQNNMKVDAKIIVNTFPFPQTRKPSRVVEDYAGKPKVFIYKKPTTSSPD